MSAFARKTWLVCYDIREPRRLRRVHKRLREEGATVQYSVFSVHTDDRGMQRLLAELLALIDARADDVRAYHVPERCAVWALGVQSLPDGVHVDAVTAARLLLESTDATAASSGAALAGDLDAG